MGALNANLMIQKEKWQARYEEVVAFLNGDSFIYGADRYIKNFPSSWARGFLYRSLYW